MAFCCATTASSVLTALRSTISVGARLLFDGKVLIAGGHYSGMPGGANGPGYPHDPVTGAFTATGNLNTALSNAASRLLDNGMVLVGGGITNSGFLSSAELYDPSTGTFIPTGNMVVARGAHHNAAQQRQGSGGGRQNHREFAL